MSPSKNPQLETVWHVTVLSNFARGYDKYARAYSKAAIPESTFPNRFYLLRESELGVGLQKAGKLLDRLSLPENCLLAMRTCVPSAKLRPNLDTGLGRYVESSTIGIDAVALLHGNSAVPRLEPISVEEAVARSLRLLHPQLHPYQRLRPRSLSLLPIARGCQAACPFCFSEASVSAEQEQARTDLQVIHDFAQAARAQGAGRFVVTGGGEPGLVRHDLLREIITTGAATLGQAILITNGHHLARREPDAIATLLEDYARAGLTVLALSRHHYDDDASERLMALRTDAAAVARRWSLERSRWPALRLRFTCVLQRGAIDSLAAMESYATWVTALGVNEICFKELYVSTSVESVYHRHATNEWSGANQVPLSLVLEFADKHGFREASRLPWGSPVFSGAWRGRRLQFAAYTEPSLLWERTHGIARSWNLMSDGRCLASLEDRASEISLPAAA